MWFEMLNDLIDNVGILLIGLGIGIILTIMLVAIPASQMVKTKTPITPDLIIEVRQGVADTTYIYRK